MIYALDLRKARVKILGAKNIIKKLFDLFFKLTLRYQPALSGSGSFFSGYPIPRKKISIAGIKIFWIFGILLSGFFRDFSEVFISRSRSPRFRDFSLGIFRHFQIPIPIPGSGFGIQDPKNLIPKPTQLSGHPIRSRKPEVKIPRKSRSLEKIPKSGENPKCRKYPENPRLE